MEATDRALRPFTAEDSSLTWSGSRPGSRAGLRRSTVCLPCGTTNEYSNEKRVDTRPVAEMIELSQRGGVPAQAECDA